MEERSTTFAGEEERSQRKSVALGSQRPGGTEDGESLQGTIGSKPRKGRVGLFCSPRCPAPGKVPGTYTVGP